MSRLEECKNQPRHGGQLRQSHVGTAASVARQPQLYGARSGFLSVR
jgi:hypothetical protein